MNFPSTHVLPGNPNPATGETRRATRIEELDGLRGIACLLVLLVHYFHDNPFFAHPAFFWVTYGFSGVHLFFVLSGFLVGGILMDAQDSPRYYQTFFMRRVCRILPLYFACLVMALFLAGFQIGLGQLIVYVLFLQNYFFIQRGGGPLPHFGATWSLAVEEQFYLTLPLAIRFIPRRRLPQVLIGGTVLVLIARYFVTMNISVIAAYTFSICRADALFLGVLAAWLWRDAECRRILETRRSLLALLTLVSLGAIVTMDMLHFSNYSREMALVGHSVFALFYASLLLCVLVFPKGLLSASLRLRPLRWVGSVSYCVYMIHYTVLLYAHQWLRNEMPGTVTVGGACTTFLAFCMTLVIAGLSWHIFEKRFVAMGQRFTYA